VLDGVKEKLRVMKKELIIGIVLTIIIGLSFLRPA